MHLAQIYRQPTLMTSVLSSPSRQSLTCPADPDTRFSVLVASPAPTLPTLSALLASTSEVLATISEILPTSAEVVRPIPEVLD